MSDKNESKPIKTNQNELNQIVTDSDVSIPLQYVYNQLQTILTGAAQSARISGNNLIISCKHVQELS